MYLLFSVILSIFCAVQAWAYVLKRESLLDLTLLESAGLIVLTVLPIFIIIDWVTSSVIMNWA